MLQRLLKKKVNQFHLARKLTTIILICLNALLVTSCASFKSYQLLKQIKVYSSKSSTQTNKSFTVHKVYITKYFLLHNKEKPISNIINKSLSLLQVEKKHQALIILQSVLKINHDTGIIHNNIAIIYESMKKQNLAEKHYLLASIKLPKNNYIRKNYLSFVESSTIK